MRYIIKPIYASMGFDERPNESHVDLMHRAIIVHQACFFSHDWCVNKAQLIYREWMRDKTQNLYVKSISFNSILIQIINLKCLIYFGGLGSIQI